MKRKTKRKLSTAIGVTLSGITMMGPYGGSLLSDYQCNRGLCTHHFHRHRYRGQP